MVAKLIKFFKRVRRGAKTVTKVKELLLPELANFPLTAPQGKQASKLLKVKNGPVPVTLCAMD